MLDGAGGKCTHTHTPFIHAAGFITVDTPWVIALMTNVVYFLTSLFGFQTFIEVKVCFIEKSNANSSCILLKHSFGEVWEVKGSV